ncbi:MAG: 4Fe-4S dicluster domain-containing protein [Chloroflexota bacterium]|nr:4Fe-4S dicluster domain-containing protein [Chloroflexota bacterium]
MARYGLAVDLARCTGCYACVIACKSENSTRPGLSWIRIQEQEEGEFPKVAISYTPMLCMQCGEVPCAQPCPTGAISRDPGGIVLINQESCYCGAHPCVDACPFGVLFVNEGKRSYFPEHTTPMDDEAYEAHPDGMVEKCDFCYQRISEGDPPACVQACPSRAMVFGDLDQETSDLARLVTGGNAEPLSEALEVNPSVFYVKERRRAG